MATIIRGSDNFDTSNVATQTELDALETITARVAFTKGVGIDSQFNVASVVSTTTTHAITFTTPMDNADYSVSTSVDYTTPADVRFQNWVRNKTVNGFEIFLGANLTDAAGFVNISAIVTGGKA